MRDRAWQLIRTHHLAPLVPDTAGSFGFVEQLNNFVRGQSDYLLVGSRREITIFPESPLHVDIDSGDTDRQKSAVSALAYCDRTFGFAPVTALAPVLRDFDCAVAYRLVAALQHDIDQNQEQARNAMQRAEYALRRHQTANPELDPSSLGPQVNGLARTRGERIQQGQEPGEALTNDINACEAQYGFAAAGGP